MARSIPAVALDLIRVSEGLRLQAYRKANDVWTIGYGHTHGVTAGRCITLSDAERLLFDDAAFAGAAVEKLVTAPLTDNQFAALVDFTFNCGAGNLGGSTLRRLADAGDYAGAGPQFDRWIHDQAGDIEPGLVTRRAAERALWEG